MAKKQLEVKSSPIAFSICFSQSSHTLHVLYQKMCCSVESNKPLQKCSQNPFFFEPQALQKITPETHFSLQTSSIWDNSTSILEKMKKFTHHLAPAAFFCAFLSFPPPFHPSQWGECLIYTYLIRKSPASVRAATLRTSILRAFADDLPFATAPNTALASTKATTL